MISSGLSLFCRFIFLGFGCNKSSHSTWTTFSDGGQSQTLDIQAFGMAHPVFSSTEDPSVYYLRKMKIS